MTDEILTEYRRHMMERFGGQIAGFSAHPALNDPLACTGPSSRGNGRRTG